MEEGHQLKSLRRMLERFAMIKITKESSVSIDDSFTSLSGSWLDKLYQSATDVGAGLGSFIGLILPVMVRKSLV